MSAPATRHWRLALAALVAAGLAPGTWWRSTPPEPDYHAGLSVRAVTPSPQRLGPFALTGAWHLTSANSHFGSWSAMLMQGDGRLLLASDRGRMLMMPPPGTPGESGMSYFAGQAEAIKARADIEALTADRATGRIWASFEGSNAVVRYEPGFRQTRTVQPPAMRGWSANSGPEAMARLADRRFIVLSEGRQRWTGSTAPALLFPGDPVTGVEPLRFLYTLDGDYRPVDMAALPDGRVLVLERRVRLGLPPRFSSRLRLFDSQQIAAGTPWQGDVLATIAGSLAENYEGLAVEPGAGGRLTLWLVSDDNNMRFQRTLLLRLEGAVPPAR